MNRFLSLLVLALGVATARGQVELSASMLLDSYAAIVNGRVITLGDVLSALQPVQERLAIQYEGRELENRIIEEYNNIRDSLIESELILLDFELQGGTIPDRAIEDHVNEVIHDRFQDDRAAFLRALAAERLTFTEWRKQMKEQLIIQVMRQREVAAKILITPLDLKKAYDRNRDRYVQPERVRLQTLSLGPAGSGTEKEAAETRARDLRDRLLAGETDFADADGTLVMDDAEWVESASLHDAIREVIDGLAPGDIAPPVEIDGDLYLIQLGEHQPARQQPLDEVTPEIEKELRRAEFNRLNQTWIDSLRAKYYVQLFSHDLFD